jgi:Na+-translocating ferredoxin:NAD+ oxidoreductase RnfG subunit
MHARWLIAPVALVASTSGYATTYLTVEQAQKAIFPDKTFTPQAVTLSADQCAAIEKTCGVRVRSTALHAWKTSDGAWFIVDEVLGKHEFITYACGIDSRGAVTGVEILEYRETYGYQVREARWRAQFTGKTARDPLKLDNDIKNISGATLSSRHVTDGVKRLLATHALVLAKT